VACVSNFIGSDRVLADGRTSELCVFVSVVDERVQFSPTEG